MMTIGKGNQWFPLDPSFKGNCVPRCHPKEGSYAYGAHPLDPLLLFVCVCVLYICYVVYLYLYL
jgi:hypothetical protein